MIFFKKSRAKWTVFLSQESDFAAKDLEGSFQNKRCKTLCYTFYSSVEVISFPQKYTCLTFLLISALHLNLASDKALHINGK